MSRAPLPTSTCSPPTARTFLQPVAAPSRCASSRPPCARAAGVRSASGPWRAVAELHEEAGAADGRAPAVAPGASATAAHGAAIALSATCEEIYNIKHTPHCASNRIAPARPRTPLCAPLQPAHARQQRAPSLARRSALHRPAPWRTALRLPTHPFQRAPPQLQRRRPSLPPRHRYALRSRRTPSPCSCVGQLHHHAHQHWTLTSALLVQQLPRAQTQRRLAPQQHRRRPRHRGNRLPTRRCIRPPAANSFSDVTGTQPQHGR